MAVKLHQLLAIVTNRKALAHSEITKAHHMVEKTELITGMIRKYEPKDELGDKLPPEVKQLQYTVDNAIDSVRSALSIMFDVIATIDVTNSIALADVVVDGKAILEEMPPTYLIFLEKQLTDLRTFVTKLPVLDASQKWEFDDHSNYFRSAEQETIRTKKTPKNHVKAEATEHHPAQVEVYMEDVQIGTWTQTLFSGAIPAKRRHEILDRIITLQEAVKFAREKANSIDAVEREVGKAIFDYIFEGNNAS